MSNTDMLQIPFHDESHHRAWSLKSWISFFFIRCFVCANHTLSMLTVSLGWGSHVWVRCEDQRACQRASRYLRIFLVFNNYVQPPQCQWGVGPVSKSGKLYTRATVHTVSTHTALDRLNWGSAVTSTSGLGYINNDSVSQTAYSGKSETVCY